MTKPKMLPRPQPYSPLCEQDRARCARRGYSLTELLIVVVLIALMTLVAIPKVSSVNDRLNVSAARDEVAAAIATARATAIQKGRASKVVFASNGFTVFASNTAGAYSAVLGPIYLDSVFRVRLVVANTADSVIFYEARGFASPRISTSARYLLLGRATRDSLCVSPVGQILPTGCSL